ncbi:hypothetical protein [Paenibacillus alvei]|uniref:Uncharacterized protein n=1 Tax=Paenibacillus alvei TaxID=44250 RepID=A0AAP7DLY4_PAEAL|nr:hypothetical protein [Paenibacillus alvei]NOJ74154.1 hypothetical protein [Paenibacillus alvei]
MKEYINFVEIKQEERIYQCKLFVQFIDSNCRIILDYNNSMIEGGGDSYTNALESLLGNFQHSTEIRFENYIAVTEGKSKNILKIEEVVKLTDVPYENDLQLEFVLKSNFKDRVITTTSFHDFSIAIGKLVREMNLACESCAYCYYGDFKSDGGEDLRHGWYCFREIQGINMEVPWFDRIEYFSQAIPNIDAFHWCPSFRLLDKIF